MKAMKGATKVVPDAYQSVAKLTGLDAKAVRASIDGIFKLAAKQLKKKGSFQLASSFDLTLEDVPGGKVLGLQAYKNFPDCYRLKISEPSKTVRAKPTTRFLKLVQ